MPALMIRMALIRDEVEMKKPKGETTKMSNGRLLVLLTLVGQKKPTNNLPASPYHHPRHPGPTSITPYVDEERMNERI